MARPRWMSSLVICLTLLGGVLPLLIYWFVLGRGVPTLTTQEAVALLSEGEDAVVLIDVRDAVAFKAKHLLIAENWPLAEIAAIPSLDQVPAQFQNRTLLLICEAGFSSAEATRKLVWLGMDQVYNIRGGMQSWLAAWDAPCSSPTCSFLVASDMVGGLTFQPTPMYAQVAGVVAGFVLKPIYMIMSLVFAGILVWKRRTAPDLLALRWALIAFFTGEAFCAAYTLYYLFVRGESVFFEYLHNYGMVLAFAFTTYAFVEGLDVRGFKLSNPGERCAALELCGPCIKYEDAPCGARRLFLLLLPLLLILSALPLFAPLGGVSYNTYVTGTYYTYTHPTIHQVFEIRYCPIVALISFGLALVALWVKKAKPAPPAAKVFFSAGLGALGFALFRLFLGTVFQNNLVWFDFWEELTELLYMASVGLVLWIFRHRLFQGATLDNPEGGKMP